MYMKNHGAFDGDANRVDSYRGSCMTRAKNMHERWSEIKNTTARFENFLLLVN